MSYKKGQVTKHQACAGCFKTGHKVPTCEMKKICRMPGCQETHHFNLHPRGDVDEMLYKRENSSHSSTGDTDTKSTPNK